MNDAASDAILICTTEDGLNVIISIILEPKGFRLITPLNQHVLFSLMELYCPRVVILDSGLSRIMGYTPWEVIKGIDRFKDTKVVLIAKKTSQYRNNAWDDADDVIDRDSISTDLLSTVCKYSSSAPEVQIHEDARRLARVIVSDIVHYNSDAAYKSAAEGTFYDILSQEIEKGRSVYQQRISVNRPHLPDYFNDAIRDFIIKTQQCKLVLP